MDWLKRAIPPPCHPAYEEALERQAQLTKPKGSLGRLEDLAVRLAAMQGTQSPKLERIWITVFAADHGVAKEGVSAFPQSVTGEMVRNFANGGAAINVLAREVGARLEIVDVGAAQSLPELQGVISRRAGKGTRNFVEDKAMTESELAMALQAGREAAERALAQGSDLYIGGEMGIANTTAASALACALLEAAPEQMVGPGTGLDAKGILHKCEVVRRALARHPCAKDEALSALRSLGGFEIAALTGAYVYCAQHRLPVLIDGFIATVAALLAVRIQPQVADWFFYAHRSQEPGHKLVLDALDAKPLLDLSMRLGEGSGAALAIPILRAACALHREMATFEQARISLSTAGKTPSPPGGSRPGVRGKMKTTTIDLLRHGDVAGGWRLLGHWDEPLSELGWLQMRALLNGQPPPWETLITSPLQRCSAFASELAERFGLRLVEDPRLMEIGLGQWEGELISDLIEREGERIQQFWNNPIGAPAPGGESYQAFERRVFQAWDGLLETHAGAHCLLLVHGGPIRVILRRILDFPVERLFQIEVPHLCLSRIRNDEGMPARLVFHGGGLWI